MFECKEEKILKVNKSNKQSHAGICAFDKQWAVIFYSLTFHLPLIGRIYPIFFHNHEIPAFKTLSRGGAKRPIGWNLEVHVTLQYPVGNMGFFRGPTKMYVCVFMNV